MRQKDLFKAHDQTLTTISHPSHLSDLHLHFFWNNTKMAMYVTRYENLSNLKPNLSVCLNASVLETAVSKFTSKLFFFYQDFP